MGRAGSRGRGKLVDWCEQASRDAQRALVMIWKVVLVLMAVAGGVWAEGPTMPEIGTTPAGVTPVEGGTSTAATTTPLANTAVAATEAASAPAGAPPVTEARPALRMVWVGADHPSGIYYAKEEGKVSLVVENTGAKPDRVNGEVEFGERAAGGADAGAAWKPRVVTPIAAMDLGPQQRARLEVGVTFAEPGPYELRWNGRPVLSANGVDLECIFPPRGAGKGAVTPWVARMPLGAGTVAGLLADYGRRTGVRRVVLEDPWPTPVMGKEGIFGGPLALDARQLDDLLADARAGGVDVIVRVELGGAGNAQQAAALHQHIAALVAHGKGAIKAMVLEPGRADRTAPAVSAYRALYLAAYDAAKKADKGILMGGAGSAAQTVALLWGKGGGGMDMGAYVDAWVADGTMADLEWARRAAGPVGAGDQARLRPVWVLPGPGQMSPAALLAEGVKVVPVWSADAVGEVGDRGVTAHLLGGAALFERVRPELPPYIAVFQGDGYALAAVAGLGAGTAVDAAWPGLVRAAGDAKARGTLAVLDDTGDMGVVDEAGREVDCRMGDNVNVPLDRRSARYVLQGGNAEDLAAVLRTAAVKGLPAVEVSATVTPAGHEGQAGAVKVQVRNATVDEVSGTVKVLATGAQGAGERVVGTQSLGPLASAKAAEVVVSVAAPKAGERLAVEVETNAGTVRAEVR